MAARGDEAIYDSYLNACLAGVVQEPDAFFERHPEAGPEVRMRIQAVHKTLRDEVPDDDVPFEHLGEFRLLRRLDAGGMGDVFVAEQESLGRVVVLKVIRPELQSSKEAMVRFEREARAVAQLRHPHIVTVHGAGTDKGVSWIAMEMVPGRRLDDILAAAAAGREPVSARRIVGWVAKLARALDYAHGRGIVHRDVKPGNIRVTPEDEPLLLDFGVAHEMGSDMPTLTRTFTGSPTYAAPEQIAPLEHEVDGRTDVYALGVTLYQCVTGVVPFTGDTVAQVFHKTLTEDPVPPRRLKETVGRDLEIVTLKAMEKDPEARYRTAAEFADDLEAILEFRPIRARPPGLVRRLYKWARRRPAAATGVAAVVVLLLALAGQQWAAAAAERREARRLVDRARAMVDDYKRQRQVHDETEREVRRLAPKRHQKYLSPDEDRLLKEKEDAFAAVSRGWQQAFYEVMDLLRRAEALDPDVPGTDLVRAAFYLEKWDEAVQARDPVAQALYRGLVERHDPDGVLGDAFQDRWGRLTLVSDPPGAEAFLFRYREQAELFAGGERRFVPVPVGGEPPVTPGTWALRVEGTGGDLVLDIAGHPVEGSVLVLFEGRVDRLLAVDGGPVAKLSDYEDRTRDPGEHVFELASGAERLEGEVLSPAQVAARGGVPARLYSFGEVRAVTLPAGLRVRATAAPLLLSDNCRIGVTPIESLRLEPGSYVILLRHEGREQVRVVFRVDRKGSAERRVLMPAVGSTPDGFVYVPADERGPAFRIMERELTAGEYLAFLDAQGEETAGLVPGGDSDYWKRGADGRFRLGDGWLPDWPVVGVTWDAAQVYVRWAAERDGAAYALPTENEWARAAGSRLTVRYYPFGNVFRPKWVSSVWARPTAAIEPVLRYPVDESPFGVYDMSGSAAEWLDAWFAEERNLRWLAGGSWAIGHPELFKAPGGLGRAADSADGQCGFRMVLR